PRTAGAPRPGPPSATAHLAPAGLTSPPLSSAFSAPPTVLPADAAPAPGRAPARTSTRAPRPTTTPAGPSRLGPDGGPLATPPRARVPRSPTLRRLPPEASGPI